MINTNEKINTFECWAIGKRMAVGWGIKGNKKTGGMSFYSALTRDMCQLNLLHLKPRGRKSVKPEFQQH